MIAYAHGRTSERLNINAVAHVPTTARTLNIDTVVFYKRFERAYAHEYMHK